MSNSRMIRWAIIMLLPAFCAANALHAQEFDKAEYKPGDPLTFSARCNDAYSLVTQSDIGSYRTELDCERNTPTISIEKIPEIYDSYVPIFGYRLRYDQSFSAVPDGYDALAIVVNSVEEQSGSFSLGPAPYLAGTYLQFSALAPQPSWSQKPYSIFLTRPKLVTPGGIQLGEQSTFLGSVAPGSRFNHTVMLPRLPGPYHLELRDDSNFKIDVEKIAVEPYFPKVALETPVTRGWQPGYMLQVGVTEAPSVYVDTFVEFILQRRGARGQWMNGGTVMPPRVPLMRANFWADLQQGRLRLLPTLPGEYRLLALSYDAFGQERTKSSEVTFQIAEPEAPPDPRMRILPGNIVFENEAIELATFATSSLEVDEWLVSLYRFSPNGRSWIPAPPADASRGPAEMRWKSPVSTVLRLPAAVEPGEYLIHLQDAESELPVGDRAVLLTDTLTVLPLDGFSVTAERKSLRLGEQQILRIDIQDDDYRQDRRFFVRIVRGEGWSPGCVERLPTAVFSVPLGAVGDKIEAPGIEPGAAPALLLPGTYRVELVFGSSPDPINGGDLRGTAPIVLASDSFEVADEIAPTRVIPMDGEVRAADPVKVTVTRPAGESGYVRPGSRWRFIEMTRAAEKARSGAIRGNDRGCRSEKTTEGAALHTEEFECNRSGIYEVRDYLPLGCSQGACPNAITAARDIAVFHDLADDTFMARVDLKDLPQVKWATQLSQAQACNEAERYAPKLSFVSADDASEALDALVAGVAFRIKAEYENPPDSPPETIHYETSLGVDGSVQLNATDNALVFLSDFVIPEMRGELELGSRQSE